MLYSKTGACGHRLMALLSTSILVLSGVCWAADTYEYFDGFYGDQAESDSYLHSPFYDEPADISLYGYFVSGPSPCGDWALRFYSGFEVDSDAYLYYRFLLGSESMIITSGTLRFHVCPWPYDMHVFVAFEEASGGFSETVGGPGYHEYDLTPAQPCTSVVVGFVGSGVYLDNLFISLEGDTPVQSRTWAAIKAQFRRE